MDKNAHYLAVGIFAIVSVITGLLFAGWLYDDKDVDDAKQFEIHFTESVDGLIKGSEVRYMGISVGKVDSTSLVPNEPQRVITIISVKENTPVSAQTVAILRTHGITGVSHINLINEPSRMGLELKISDTSDLPILESSPSNLGGVMQSLPALQKNLNQIINQINQTLSQKNLDNFAAVLENMNTLLLDANQVFSEDNLNNLSSLLANINTTAEAGPELIADLRKTTGHLNQLVSNMDKLVSSNETELSGSIQDLRATLKNVSKMTDNYSRLAVQLNKMASNNQEQINELIADGGHDLKQLLHESRRTANAVKKLSDKLEQNPSQILYEPTQQGVKMPR